MAQVSSSSSSRITAGRPDWRSSVVWRLGFILSSVNGVYFGVNAFMPSYLTSVGRADLISAALTALNIAQLPSSAIMLAIAHRIERRAWPMVITGLLMLLSVGGIAFTASAWTVAFAALLGFFGAATLTIGFALPAMVSAPEDVGRVSAAMFTISYTLAMLFSVASGMAWDFAGNPQWAFLPIAISILPQVLLIGTIRFPSQDA